jgi:hypothetical protein
MGRQAHGATIPRKLSQANPGILFLRKINVHSLQSLFIYKVKVNILKTALFASNRDISHTLHLTACAFGGNGRSSSDPVYPLKAELFF